MVPVPVHAATRHNDHVAPLRCAQYNSCMKCVPLGSRPRGGSLGRALCIVLVSLGLVFACGSPPDYIETTNSPPRGPREYVEDDSLFRACVELVAARCERKLACGGDNDARDYCVRSAALNCPDEVFGPGSNFTREGALACVDEWRDFDCDALRHQEQPACASLAGNLADGEPCLYSSQCQHGCLQFGTPCGYCAPWAEPGGGCVEGVNVCRGLSTCFEETCVAEVFDEPCGGPCAETEVCVYGRCSAPSQVGGACAEGQTGPDIFHYCTEPGLLCLEGTCQPQDVLPGEGESCLIMFNGGSRFSLCRQGLFCTDDGTCVQPKLGGPCVGIGQQCGEGQVCFEDVCVERLQYRQQGCEDTYTHCDKGTECRDNACHESTTSGSFAEACGD